MNENEDHLLESMRGEQYKMPANFICSTVFSHIVAYIVTYLKVTIFEILKYHNGFKHFKWDNVKISLHTYLFNYEFLYKTEF